MSPADVFIVVFVGYWVSYLLGFVAMVLLDHDLRYLHWLEECPIPILPPGDLPLVVADSRNCDLDEP